MIGIVILGLALGVVGSEIVEAEINLQDKIQVSGERSFSSIDRLAVKSSRSTPHQEKSSETVERAFHVDNESSTPLFRGRVPSVSHDSSESLSNLLLEMKGQPDDAVAMRLPFLTVFFRYWPAILAILFGGVCIALLENWGGVDALYFTVVTATTIGFGDYSASLSITKLCCVIFIPLSVAATGNILGQVASHIIECRREEKLKKLWSTGESTPTFLCTSQLRKTKWQQIRWKS